MKEAEEKTRNLGARFAQLHQILLMREGNIYYWGGEAGEAWLERVNDLYEESCDVLLKMEKR